MSTFTPSLSVIIPLYNGKRWLPQLEATLGRQHLFDPEPVIPVEVILVDDGSTDGTPEAARELALCHPAIRLITQTNAGQGAARNRGMDEARMEYVYMMDQDDILAPDVLIPLTITAAKEEADVLRFRFATPPVEESGRLMDMTEPRGFDVLYRMTGPEFIQATGGLIREIAIWSSLLRREFMNRHSLRFDPLVKFSDDELLTWSVMLKAEKVILTDCLGYYWVQHPTSTSHSTNLASKLALNVTIERLVERERALLPLAQGRVRELLERAWRWHEFRYWAFVMRHNAYPASRWKAKFKAHIDSGALPIRGDILYRRKHLRPNATTFALLWRICKSPMLMRTFLTVREKFGRATASKIQSYEEGVD